MDGPKVFLAFLLAVSCVNACVSPSLAPGFTNQGYMGDWYEIGKIQTAGGAAFQKDCLCTKSTFNSDYPVYGDATIHYECRMYSTENPNITQSDAILTAGENPGNFQQVFLPFSPPGDYNIIWLDQDTAMEYDCIVKPSGVEEYCVHFLSRTDTIDSVKLEEMIAYAEGLGLNPQNIPYLNVILPTCW